MSKNGVDHRALLMNLDSAQSESLSKDKCCVVEPKMNFFPSDPC